MAKKEKIGSNKAVTKKALASMSVLDFIDRAGLKKTDLARDHGFADSWIFGLKKSPLGRPYKLLSDSLISRGEVLAEFDFSKHDLKETIESAGWTIKAIAERIGCSPQWVHQMLANGYLTDERKRQIQKIVRSMGQEMISHGVELSKSVKKAA